MEAGDEEGAEGYPVEREDAGEEGGGFGELEQWGLLGLGVGLF